jgi:flagellar basal body rod protein FlgG
MNDALTIAIQSMQNDTTRMVSISRNIANVTTPGYRREISVQRPFAAVFGSIAAPADRAQLRTAADTTTAAVKQTGRPLDLALQGSGYFEMMTPTGVAYTRGGAFQLDASGKLTDGAGNSVQGNGGDLVLGAGPVAIEANGQLKQDGRVLGTLRIVQFESAHALERGEDGLLRPRVGAVQATATPARVLAGHLEASNVTQVREMAAMMETSRRFEAAQKLFQGYDEQLGNAIQKLGEF